MIEALAKAAEGLGKVKETSSSYDLDKKIEKNSLNTDQPKEEYDPDKKVEKETNDNTEQKVLTQEQKEKIKN